MGARGGVAAQEGGGASAVVDGDDFVRGLISGAVEAVERVVVDGDDGVGYVRLDVPRFMHESEGEVLQCKGRPAVSGERPLDGAVPGADRVDGGGVARRYHVGTAVG